MEREDLNPSGITVSHFKNLSFSGHQTFPFRYTWLKKGVDAVKEEPSVFSSEEAIVTLGIGKNMVASIRHWCLICGLIKREGDGTNHRGRFVPTALGNTIFAEEQGLDAYLENPASLWAIHWRIATNVAQATTWFWAFNIFRENHFTRAAFKRELETWIAQQRKSMQSISSATLERDVNCFIRTYCQTASDKASFVEETFTCPLVELNLITELPVVSTYQFQRRIKETLPQGVVTWAIDDFWVRRFPKQKTLRFSELMYAPGSPGRVFKLDEDAMTVYLETLEHFTDGALQYDETAGLKQVYRRSPVFSMELLRRYYE